MSLDILSHGAPKVPKDLQTLNCIRYLGSSVEKQWELHQGRKRISIPVDGVCASSSVVISAQAAREDLGVVMLPRHLASHPTYGAGLVRVLLDWEGTPVNVFAVTADRKLSARCEELIRVVHAQFAKQLAQLETTESSSPVRQS